MLYTEGMKNINLEIKAKIRFPKYEILHNNNDLLTEREVCTVKYQTEVF
jgi:hypothetical protein